LYRVQFAHAEIHGAKNRSHPRDRIAGPLAGDRIPSHLVRRSLSILFSEKGLSAMLYGTLAPTGNGSADIRPLRYYT